MSSNDHANTDEEIKSISREASVASLKNRVRRTDSVYNDEVELEDGEIVGLDGSGFFRVQKQSSDENLNNLLDREPLSPSKEEDDNKEGESQKKWTPAPKTRRRTGTIAKNFIGNRDPKQRPIALKVDCNVGGIQGKVAKAFAAGMKVSAVIKFLMKRFPETEGDFGIFYPGSSEPESKNKDGFWLDNEKFLLDYDDTIFKHMLQLKNKNEKKKQITREISKAPLPKIFFDDPAGKVKITRAERERTQTNASEISDTNSIQLPPAPLNPNESLTITFEFKTKEPVSDDAIIKEGELFEQGGANKGNWKARHAILQGDSLFIMNPKVKDDPTRVQVRLRGCKLKEMQGKPSSYFGFELIEPVDEMSEKPLVHYLGTKSKEEYDEWMNALKEKCEETSFLEPQMVTQEIVIQYNPESGYVGLSDEWKQVLSDCGITERYFYENPEEVVQLLRFNQQQSSQQIISHKPVKTASKNINDIVNKDMSPNMLYKDFQLIGAGTFGEVYKAINTRSQQQVAIKKMLLTPKREPLFINEIIVQKSTEHPNVVKMFDAFKVNDHIWVALEFMEGGNLYQVLSALEANGQFFKEPQIAYVMFETLKALSYIHGKHRIHRDIKSDNLLIGTKGEIKLADFGYAVQLTDEDEKRQTLCGSPYWMAPEIIRGEKYGKQVDIWALGIMLMECCDLQPPYISEAPSKALLLITQGPPPPLKKPEKWSPELKHFLNLCINLDASKRPKAIELLQHPFLRCTCNAMEFRDYIEQKIKKQEKNPCLIQ